ncbi:SPRY-domain-containing protein [Polychaeton citri CBS 116435]|uniref:Protein SSH4 n=1 Tax=Polychaeton citri CBS 116435 TaxID=1314669 RepID=A0A9P4UNC0_9PEZI|nr:SPRY-domain-containing protein [Polychaeton citri CBS 116435]
MAQQALSAQHGARVPTFATSIIAQPTHSSVVTQDLAWEISHGPGYRPPQTTWNEKNLFTINRLGSTGKGILIGMLSAFGSAALVALVITVVYFFRYTNRGRILLDRMGRPGEFDDEQQLLREEEEAMANMDDLQKAEYLRAKAFVQANPPESAQTDISLSQFLAIQEKGVSAWEFEPELEIANCFVEARTEIEFFDSECSVQSNLPIPKQNEVYYWEAKLYDKPESTLVSVGLTTKPYPLFRLPGLHRVSLAYTSTGQRRYNQPFTGTNYGPPMQQGDVIGIGYRPRTGTIFFTRNGKKLEDVAHGWKSQNFFPTIGANGPCNVHVNFGQMGFVFIEANVKKWGLAPQTGSLAPPPPYGSEQGSILLEGGREGVREGQGYFHARTNSAQVRLGRGPTTTSPGPQRSPTDISLAQFNLMDSNDEEDHSDNDDDTGEGMSESSRPSLHRRRSQSLDLRQLRQDQLPQHPEILHPGLPLEPHDHPPPEYESPEGEGSDADSTPRASQTNGSTERLLSNPTSPPIPSYEAATSGDQLSRGRSSTR